MCNVRTHVRHENMMSRVQTYVTSTMCNVRTYATHEYEIILSELMLHAKMCIVRTYVTHEYDMHNYSKYKIYTYSLVLKC